ncbi:MAG: DUF5668 domain-containing protein [Bacteroidota bacterium]
MKSGRVFWGVFFLGLGGLFLLNSFELWSFNWGMVVRLWPVIFILWGIAALVPSARVKWVIAGLIGLVVAILVYWFFSFRWFHDDEVFFTQRGGTEYHAEPFVRGTERATLVVNSGAGSFRMDGNSTDLIEAETRTTVGGYRLRSWTSERSTDLELSLKKRGDRWVFWKWRNSVTVRLHPEPLWDLRFNLGAFSGDLDLRPYRIEKLEIDGGASSVRIRLGDRAPETSVAVRVGVSAITIEVPETAGCRLTVSAPLSGKRFPGFVKQGKGRYETENFDSAGQKIFIDLEGGVSSFRVRRTDRSL